MKTVFVQQNAETRFICCYLVLCTDLRICAMKLKTNTIATTFNRILNFPVIDFAHIPE